MNYNYNMDFLSSPRTVEREASRRSQYSRDDIRNYLGSQSDRRDMDVENDLLSHPPSELAMVLSKTHLTGLITVTSTGHLKGTTLKGDPQAPQDPQKTLSLWSQGAHKHSSLNMTYSKQLRTPISTKLIRWFTLLSLVIPGDVILLTLNSRRWAGLWPRECSIHRRLKDDLSGKLMLS